MECGAHSESYLRNHMHGCGLAARDTVFLKPGPWSTYDRRELCSRQGVEDKPMALRIELKLQTTGIIWRACQRHAGEPHPQYFSPVGLGRSRQFASLPNRAEASTEDPTRVENCCFRESPKPHFSVCSVKYQLRAAGEEGGRLVKRLLLWSQLEIRRAQTEEVGGGMERE